MRKTICAAVLFLSACSSTQIASTTSDISTGIAAACADVMKAVPVAQAAVKGGAANTVSSIAGYATAACATGTAVAALAQNSGTLQWIGTLQGQLQAAAVPATPAP